MLRHCENSLKARWNNLPNRSPHSTANVNSGTARRVRFGLPQNFVRHRRSVALAKEDELQHVEQRVPLSPAKIDVRNLSRLVADVKQKGRNRVGHRRTLSPQYFII